MTHVAAHGMTGLKRRQCWVRLAQYCDELLAAAARNAYTASHEFTYPPEKRELFTALGLYPPRTLKGLAKLRAHQFARTKWLKNTKWHTVAPANHARSRPHQRNRFHRCPRPTQQNRFHSRPSSELPLPPRFFDGGMRRSSPAPMPLQQPQQVQNIMGSFMQPPPPAVQQLFKFHAQLLLQNPELMRADHHLLQQQMLPMAGTCLPQTQSNMVVPRMWLPAQHNGGKTLAAQ